MTRGWIVVRGAVHLVVTQTNGVLDLVGTAELVSWILLDGNCRIMENTDTELVAPPWALLSWER